MQLAVRPHLAAGIAIAGVGVLAVSPVAPSMPDLAPVAHSSAAVELSALANPIEGYAEAFSTALVNLQALGERIGENPAPILSQIVTNQMAAAAGIGTFVQTFGQGVFEGFLETPERVQAAAEKFAAGDVTGALTEVQNAILGPIVNGVIDTLLFNPAIWTGFQDALRQPFANVLAVVDILSIPNVYSVLGPMLAPVQLLTDMTDAIGAAGDGIFAGIKGGDLEQVANAVLNLGPDLTQAILNGNPMAGGFAAGLLGPNGVVAGLLTLRDMVADAITPPAATTALAAAGLSATPRVTTVTLDVAPQASAIEAPKVQTETSTETATKVAVTEAASEEAVATAADTETAAKDTVKESPKAVPGKTGTRGATKKVNPLKDVGDGIRGAFKNVNKDVKNAVSGLKPGKIAKTEKSSNSQGSTGSASGGAE